MDIVTVPYHVIYARYLRHNAHVIPTNTAEKESKIPRLMLRILNLSHPTRVAQTTFPLIVQSVY